MAQAPLLSLAAASDGDHLHLAVQGELDVATAHVVEDAVTAHLDGDVAEVEVDLRQVRFFGAAAVSALLSARSSALGAGASFTVLPSTAVRRVLSLTAVDQVLDVVPAG